jgi:hypothetical protein
MMRATIAALLTTGASAWLLTACAGSPPKPTSVPLTATAQPSPPAPPRGQQAAGTPAPTAAAPVAPVDSAAASSPATPASVAAPDGTTSSGSAGVSGSVAAAPGSLTGPGPAGPGPVATPTTASSESAAPGSPGEPAAAPSAAVPPVPGPSPVSQPATAPAPRVLLADELPYAPAHLRAHDTRPEHHRAREANRESPGGRPYHPAPGIVVDVVDAQGGATASALQRAARNLGYWPFRQCYEEGLRREPRLAGKVALELVVSPTGAVDRSVVTATTVRDEIVAACVAREAQRLALPSGDSPTTARVDVSLVIGDEPVPTGRPVPAAEPIREALRGSWGAVRRCYAGRLAGHPGVGGRVELHFHVRHGEIVDVDELGAATEGGGRLGDPEVTRCLIGVYRRARLPASHGQRERSFVYALQLESMPVGATTP